MRAIPLALFLMTASAHADPPTPAEQSAAEAAFARVAAIEPVTPDAFTGPDTALFAGQEGHVYQMRAAKTDWSRDLANRIARDQFWRRTADPDFTDKLGLDTPGKLAAFRKLTGERWDAVDAANTAWLKAEIDRRGAWPPISEVGQYASNMLWLLVQHADRETTFQKRALALMEPLFASGEVSKQNYAYLWDRVAMHDNRLSRYGTQGHCVAGQARWEPFAMEDPDHVDQRRAEMDLEPLASYVTRITSGGVCR